MKIAIVSAQVPFVWGGAEYLAESLHERLVQAGHRVESIRIPFKWYPESALIDSTMACRLLRIDAGDPDLVIALKFPGYSLPFENKRVWLLHQFRQVYEMWGTPLAGLPDTPEGQRIRDMIVQGDNLHLRQTRGLYTISRNVANRLLKFNGIEADEVIYPPLKAPELFGPGEQGDYFFYPSRLSLLKRQHLAIEAMRHVRSPFRLVLAGKPDEQAYGDRLTSLVRQHGLEDRVEFLGFISEQEKARRMAGAFATVFLPFDEDYGLVTLESFHSHKAAITLTDSGGPTEFITHGENGLVVDPTPEALAEGMEKLWADRARTRRMGEEAHATITRRGIVWPRVLERLAS